MSPLPKFSTRQVRDFRKRLLRWFDREQRQLPWRGETDPYRILVSEIMLQQTRVAVVQERYKTFLQQFPTAEKLARAREQTVLAAWSGLGYYRRARALHAAAKHVSVGGCFPRSSSAMAELPGVGRYTAAAMASIAYGEAIAVVDGNVKRVLGRLSGRELREDQNWQLAGELLDPKSPGNFNQAMMELGATVCLSGKPHCELCPVVILCAGKGSDARREKTSRRKGILRYSLIQRNGDVFLRQRPKDASLMAGMWELPERSGSGNSGQAILKLKHSITVTDYTVVVFPDTNVGHPGRWVPISKVGRMALTGLTRKILTKLATKTHEATATRSGELTSDQRWRRAGLEDSRRAAR
jgi:A/G-specific adenine glycosylase